MYIAIIPLSLRMFRSAVVCTNIMFIFEALFQKVATLSTKIVENQIENEGDLHLVQ
jgi:hypothetical protein